MTNMRFRKLRSFFGGVLCIDLIVFLVALFVMWAKVPTFEVTYGQVVIALGAIVMAMGALGVLGSYQSVRSFAYQYVRIVGVENAEERIRRDHQDLAASGSFILMTLFAGVIAVGIGLLL